jgi:hypothetical protein
VLRSRKKWFPLKVGDNVTPDAHTVVGVYMRLSNICRLDNGVFGVTEHAPPASGVVSFVRRQIPVPDTVVDALSYQCVARLGFARVTLRTLEHFQHMVRICR